MRLIDADALLKKAQALLTFDGAEVIWIHNVMVAPTIDPIRAAGGCRCGECKRYMTPKCLLCSFDVDGSCTGGPESDFYCGDSELREAQNDE